MTGQCVLKIIIVNVISLVLLLTDGELKITMIIIIVIIIALKGGV